MEFQLHSVDNGDPCGFQPYKGRVDTGLEGPAQKCSPEAMDQVILLERESAGLGDEWVPDSLVFGDSFPINGLGALSNHLHCPGIQELLSLSPKVDPD